MKQKLLYILFFMYALGWSLGVDAQSVYYITVQSGEKTWTSPNSSDAFTLPENHGSILSFEAERTPVLGFTGGSVYAQYSNDKKKWTDAYEAGLSEKNKWYSFSCSNIPLDAKYVRFQSKTGATGTKHIRNVKISRATTLSVASSPLAFGNVQKGSSLNKTISVSYNNTYSGAILKGTCDNPVFTVTQKNMGETGSENITVTYSPTALGQQTGTVTLTMGTAGKNNDKTCTFTVSGTGTATYYGKASATAATGGNAYVSFSSYDGATTANATTNTSNTTAANASKTAYYKAVANSGYRFVGWTLGSENYTAGYKSTSATYNPTVTYSSESSSSPTATTYKAWFAPMFYFSATAVPSNDTSGTVTAEVTEEIQGNIGDTSKSATATFTATPKDNCTFEGWYSSSSYTGTPVSTSTTYSVNLTNNVIGSTSSKTLYALFKKNQNLQWTDPDLDLNLVVGTDDLSAASVTSNKTITYTSSNTDAVTIDADGTIHAVGLGQSVVTASVEGDLTYNAETISREFTVGEKKQASFTPAWGEGTSTDIKVGSSTTISLTNIATDATFTVSATPTGVISWTRNGNTLTINGDVAGTASLTLAQTGNKYLYGNTANYTITVSKYANTFALAAEEKAMEVGEVWQNVVTGSGNNNTQVAYSVSGVAIYDAINNRVVAESEGSTVITFTQAATATHEAVSKSLNVTVSKVANTLSLSLPTQEVDVDGTITVSITGKNSNAPITAEITDAELSSGINNGTDVITYANGIITAKNAGTAKIKFTQAANDKFTGFESGVYEITVNKITNTISFTLAGGSASNIKLKYGATATLSYSSTHSDNDIVVRRRSGTFTTYSNGTITAGNTAGTDIYEIKQAETYKYTADYVSFTVRVNNTDEAVGYVLNEATEYSHGTGSGVVHTYELSGPGETVYYSARTQWAAIYYDLYVEYSTDNSSWEEIQDNKSLSDSYKDFSCAIPENARYLRFRFPAGGTLTKYIKNVKVTRKTYVRASSDKTAFGEVYTDQPQKAIFTVDYSTTNGGNITVNSSNPNFVPKPTELSVEDNSDGTKTFTVTYTPNPDHLGPESADITVSDLFYSQKITLTATAKKYGTTIMRGSNTATTTTVDGTIDNAFDFTGTSSAVPSNNNSADFYYTISQTQTSAVNNGEGVIRYDPVKNTITGLNAGSARLTIYQKKTAQYNATSEVFDFTVTKLPNNVTLGISATTLNVDGTATITVANDDSQGAISASFSNVLYSNEAQNREGGLLSYTSATKAITGVNAGTGTVTVSQAETYKYEGKSATFNVTVNKLAQTLTWDNPDMETTMQKGTTHEGNTAKSSAGLTPVTYASSNTAAITVDANTGVLAAVEVGSNVTITASQAGNYKYLPATLSRLFSVFNKQTPAFSVDEHFTGLNGRIEIEGTATITVTGVSDEDDFSITNGDNSIISVERDGETITITGLTLGSTTLTLSQEGNDDFIAKSVTYNIEVYMPDDYLTLTPSEAPTFVAGTYRRVVLNRTLKAGYNSLALPFNTTVEEIMGADYDASTDWVAQLSIVTYNKQDGYSLYFEKSNEITANQPYILHLGTQRSSVVFRNVVLVNAAPVEQTATSGVSNYSDWQMVSNYAIDLDMEGKYGIVNADDCLKKGAAGSTLKAYTAYIVYNGAAPAQVKAAYLEEDEADALLRILRGEGSGAEDVYDMQGRKLPRSQRGINIIRGADGIVRKIINR
ncbi:MAG: hypothetical protein IJ826_00175 [Bacteroidaceae bacterium]|nr:hypothetical protein [Bacteroidaceae bacterium]